MVSPISIHDDGELYDFVVIKGNGVKGLADSKIASLFKRYVHPPNERIDPKQVIDASPYLGKPIDLSGLEGENREAVIHALCRAAEKSGFFQVINHGVQLEVLERVKQAAHNFFNLPPVKKAVFLKGKTSCRRVHYGTSFVPRKEKSLEWKDYLSMVHVNDEEAMQFWPPECREAILDYLRAAKNMINAILSVLLRNLGVKIDESIINLYMEGKGVNMNYYPACPNPELTVGIGRHSDIGTLTILLQDDIGGLFVSVEDKGWIAIPPVEGALVINVGDTLEILSNGRYKSAEHRVLASSTKPRVSVPIFVSPPATALIEPLPGLPEKDGKTAYRQVLFGEYTTKFFGAAHGGKKTLDFVRVETQN